MKTLNKILISVSIVVAFGAGFYFKDGIINFCNSLINGVQDIQKTKSLSVITQASEVGSMVVRASKEFLTPPPLLSYKKTNSGELLKSKIISETNLQRKQNGNLPALNENVKLYEAAGAKANDMFANQYFEHISPAGMDPGKLLQNHGYEYLVAGENLILGNFASEKELVEAWMGSPEHRANILNNRYTEIGVAIIKGTYKGQTVWIGVQEFGLPLSTCSEPSAGLEKGINLQKTQLDALLAQVNESKNRIDSTDQNSPIYNQMVSDYNQWVEQYNSLAEQIKAAIANYNNQVNTFNDCLAGTGSGTAQ
jgi:uncharacterized protein YkwD